MYFIVNFIAKLYNNMRKFLLFGLFLCYLTFLNAGNPGYLGISINDYVANHLKGVQVVNVFDDGAAKQYGIKENDIITSINGITVLIKSDLTNQIDSYNWGDKVHIEFIRNGVNASTDVYLGYKSTIRTYNVKRKITTIGELWQFSDDNTEVQLNNENEPLYISKKNANGITDSWKPFTNYKDDEVPQYFLDLSEKMYCINKIREDQAKRNCKINDIIFIKKTKLPVKDDVPSKVELFPELFSITPNPTNGLFSVNVKSNEKGTAMLTIFDITGRVVNAEMVQNFTGEYTIPYNLQNEAKGAYLIQLKIGEKITTKKILLQ